MLVNLNLLVGPKILDYGCGKSIDYKYFNGMDRYDPYYYNNPVDPPYDTIICHYVLNVVTEKEQEEIINHIKQLLKPSGKAYFTVRRDIKDDIHYEKYSQRVVELPFKTIKKYSAFEIYEYINEN